MATVLQSPQAGSTSSQGHWAPLVLTQSRPPRATPPTPALPQICLQAAPRPSRPSRPSRRRRWKLLLAAVAILMALLTLTAAIFLAILPDVGDAQVRTAHILSELGGTSATIAPESKIAKAIVAIEDRRFYQHPGVDPVSLVRAAWDTVTTGSPGGAATIAQQLAKNLYVPDDDRITTKFEQLGIGVKLEMHYSKTQVLQMYLNAIYYGEGQWGVEQASRRYFGKEPQDLDWAEPSLLAGLPQAPSAYAPNAHFDLAKERQREVLDALVRDEALTQAQSDEAYAEPLNIQK